MGGENEKGRGKEGDGKIWAFSYFVLHVPLNGREKKGQ